MAEDHGLGDGDGSVDVTQSLELLLLAVAQHVVLFDGASFISLNSPLDADALVLVALRGDHDVGLVQHKHFDLLGVYELEFTAPVQHGARSADNYLLTLISSNGVDQFDLRVVFSHLLDHLAGLKCQFIGG
uniref:Uncharacterized protein n=1 Tax=Salarias fasciatus TaxID=181472 RepID=A0A672G5A9_SALFA